MVNIYEIKEKAYREGNREIIEICDIIIKRNAIFAEDIEILSVYTQISPETIAKELVLVYCYECNRYVPDEDFDFIYDICLDCKGEI